MSVPPAAGSPEAPPPVAGALASDPWIRVGAVLWVATVALVVLPILPPTPRIWMADGPGDALVLVLVAAAAALRAREAAGERARMFWWFVTGIPAAFLAVHVTYQVVPAGRWSRWADLATDLLYLAGYVCAAFALELRPSHPRPVGARARAYAVERAGILVAVLGFLAYLVLIPSLYDPDAYLGWYPSLSFFALLDLGLLVGVRRALAEEKDTVWRGVYVALGVTFALWFLGDATEAVMYAGLVPDIPVTSPVNVLWYLPELALLVAVRWGAAPSPAPAPGGRPPPPPAGGGPANGAPARFRRPGPYALVTLALALPAAHAVVELAAWGAPEVRTLRSGVVLISVLIFAGLLVEHQRLLRRAARTLQRERREAEEQLQMARRMEVVGRLASGVAHDFSNVLSVVVGRSELLLEEGGLDETAREDVEEIADTARRGGSLIRHLLALARDRSGRVETLDLADVVADLHRLLARVLPESVRLTVRGSPDPCPVRADRTRLEQVVLNLVVNARDAVGGTGRITVSTGLVEVDETLAAVCPVDLGPACVRLAVEDDGPGIPPEIRHRVFEPFFTSRAHQGGSGLGLAIVYSAVTEAGGYVRVGDAPGGGALVEAFFPRSAEPVSALEPRLPEPDARPGSTVLLVEDDRSVRGTLRRILHRSGYRVLEAPSGADALEILERRSEDVSLLLADVGLPDLSGFDLYVRAVAVRPALATVLMTGYPLEGPPPPPYSGPVLRKPFTPDVLLRAVDAALRPSAPA